ncbi:hypothetical protein GGR26_002303 [Lewinella marina]|uniref:Secretion system C-terminal sorting domain-containing protein n=1 Tax=Neolewinella marina TaxID=438751 RepID=A0A2G0CGB5_9BACT|nr:T9SS type A sorting domain-containing protein [Neolewinella marina]NJB86535.1 hypothetical protein [Neolewinella marina]PHK99011.1 hypothetical protein CGL56_05995 [Neolewinella marina]
MKLFYTLLFTGLSLVLGAQGVCVIDASNANQDFCTACTTGVNSGNPALVNGVFTGSLEVHTSYTISADCLAGIEFAGNFDIWIARHTNLTFAADPMIADGTTTTVSEAHHVHSGYIWVFGVQYTPRSNNGTSYNDLAALMTSPENNRTTVPGPAPAPGGGGETMLPITLLEWEASLLREGVEVRWSTLREANNDFFVVEHSTDGLNFTILTQQSGAGNSKGKLTYNYYHATPAAGTNFYRLTQYDLDGSFTTYPVITSEFQGVTPTTGIYPNPATAGQAIRFAAPSARTTANLYHLDGRLIASTPVGTNAFDAQFQLPNSLQPGVYLLRVGSQGQRLLVR